MQIITNLYIYAFAAWAHEVPHRQIKYCIKPAQPKRKNKGSSTLVAKVYHPLEYPHIEEKEENSGEKAQPDLPPYTSTLRHAQHAIHIPAELYPGALEGVFEGI